MRYLMILAVCVPATGFAQSANEVTVTLGLGGQTKPAYFGADQQVLGPTGSFALESLDFGGVSTGGDAAGVGFGGSLRYIGARKAADHDALAGLTDLDAALELGGGLRYGAPGFDAFVNLRYGVVGHESLVADFGADFVQPLGVQWELRAGPRALWGSDDYAQTYFGVSVADSLASDLDPFDPAGGLISAGIKASLSYQATQDWGVTATLGYDRLQGDAAQSPIVQSKHQTSLGVVVTRRLTIAF